MNILFEYHVMQNPALLMTMQYEAISNYCKHYEDGRGVKFPLVFILTPIIFQKRLIQLLCNRKGKGSLYRAIAEDRKAWLGLQRRMEANADLTLQALQLGLQTQIIEFVSNTGTIRCKGKCSVKYQNETMKRMKSAAKRLGDAFAELTEEEIALTLNIVF